MTLGGVSNAVALWWWSCARAVVWLCVYGDFGVAPVRCIGVGDGWFFLSVVELMRGWAV